MPDMAMTPEEAERFWKMEAAIDSIKSVIVGDPLQRRPGFAERLNQIEDKQDSMDLKLKRLTYLFMGIGIGVIIGGALFGYLSWRQVADMADKAFKIVK